MNAFMEEEALIEGSLAGQREAFGQIVRKYQSLVCSVAYSFTGDLALSEDLAQETFLNAWQRLGDLRDRAKLGPWLCGIVKNLARDSLRRKKRDLTRNAVALNETVALPKTVPPADRVTQTEREAVMWAALEDIPEMYREPLILFYRQGESIRDVAEALELTEDCVKQRLSRGRKMLKEQVSAFVEDSLAKTAPSEAFTAAVVAALPAMAIAKSAAAATGTIAAGKGAIASISAAVLGIALANLVYMTWGFFGMWTSILNSRTLRVRRYMLKVSAISYCGIWGFVGLQGMIGMCLWRRPAVMFTAIGVAWLAYIIWLFTLILVAKLKTLRLLEEDLGTRPAPSRGIEESALSRRRVWWRFAWTTPVALLGSFAFLLWLHYMPWTHALWGAPFVALGHGIYFPLFMKGMRIARDEATFAATAPCAQNAQRRARATRLSWIAGGGMGLVVAPVIWGPALAVLAGDIVGAVLTGAVIAAVTMITASAIKRRYDKGHLYMFYGLAFLGFFIPAVIAWKQPVWAAALGLSIAPVQAWASAAIYFGINACFALVELIMHVKLQGRSEN